MYAHIAFPIANYKQFVYSIPTQLLENIQQGICVEAPFKNKTEIGFVVNISDTTSYKKNIKSIINIMDNDLQIQLE